MINVLPEIKKPDPVISAFVGVASHLDELTSDERERVIKAICNLMSIYIPNPS